LVTCRGSQAALRRGDEAAFAWLHDAWSGRINRYCFALAAGDEPFAREMPRPPGCACARHVRVVSDEQALWNWIACAARHAATDLRRTGGPLFPDAPPLCGMVGSARPIDTDADRSLLAALEPRWQTWHGLNARSSKAATLPANRWKPSAHARRFPCARRGQARPAARPLARTHRKELKSHPYEPNQTKLPRRCSKMCCGVR